MPVATNDEVAMAVLLLVSIVVFYDGWRLIRSRVLVPKFGNLPEGGWAWTSDSGRELVRNGPNLVALAAMMVLPWMLAERSGTEEEFVLLFDMLLLLHCVWLIIPKRYAITSTHLFVDGMQYSHAGLRYTGWKGGTRVVLQRRGWWIFAPLPLGGVIDDLVEVAARLQALSEGGWVEFETEGGAEESE